MNQPGISLGCCFAQWLCPSKSLLLSILCIFEAVKRMKVRRNISDNHRSSWACASCDLPLPLNELGLCAGCAAKLERDLIRARDWEYSMAFMLPPEQREVARARVISDYGAANELFDLPIKPKRKNKRSHSRATQYKREIATKAPREYSTEDVLQATREFIQEQHVDWVNFSRVAQHLYEHFYHLKPKRLGQPGKKYRSLVKFIADYPSDFQLRSEPDHHGVYWIRLV